jgi:hypothetical protein
MTDFEIEKEELTPAWLKDKSWSPFCKTTTSVLPVAFRDIPWLAVNYTFDEVCRILKVRKNSHRRRQHIFDYWSWFASARAVRGEIELCGVKGKQYYHLIDVNEAAEKLRMIPGRVVRLASKGVIPTVILPDNELRFDPLDLDKWIDEYKKQSTKNPGKFKPPPQPQKPSN